MKKSLLSVALCVMTLLIGISPVSAQGQNKEYQERCIKCCCFRGLATVDRWFRMIIGMNEAAVPLCIGGHVERSNGKGKAVFQR